MKQRRTILDPTIWIYLQATGRDPNIGVWGANITGLANDMGVRVVAGTDDMGTPWDNKYPILHTEMELLVNMSHFTPLQAITSATKTGAEALGIEKDYGTIERGKVADLVILNTDPSIDIRNTKDIYRVVKQGVMYSPN